jgi:hypothetical protein
MVSIYDWYIIGACGALLGLYILLVWFDKGGYKMSDITYIFLQMLVLLCYGSWIAYRVGYQKGSQTTLEYFNTKVAINKRGTK